MITDFSKIPFEKTFMSNPTNNKTNYTSYRLSCIIHTWANFVENALGIKTLISQIHEFNFTTYKLQHKSFLESLKLTI